MSDVSQIAPTAAGPAESVQILFRKLASSRWLVFGLFTLVYLFETVRIAREKLLWEDEFFTFYLSRIPNWHGLLTALATGADQHPPSFYELTHWFLHLFGSSPVTVRLPAVLGFWLLCICLYEIVRQLMDPCWAVVGMLFPVATSFYYYASEARGYGPEAGFVALALLGWLKATSGRNRIVFLPLLAIGLAGAVGMHYYAAAVVLCLAGAELVRALNSRKVDLPVWAALAFGFVPLLAFRKTIRAARGYSGHFWAVPDWSDVPKYYQTELGAALLTITIVAAVTFLVQGGKRSSRSGEPELHRKQTMTTSQTVAVCSLAAIPFIVEVAAKYVTHGFSDRYAIAGLVGVAILVCYVLYRAAPDTLMAVAVSGACFVCFLSQVRFARDLSDWDRDSLHKTIAMLQGTNSLPIDIMHVDVFYRASFYAPRELASRLQYVADPASSIQYLHQDTLDRGLLDLRPWFPLNAVTLDDFLSREGDFVAYGEANKWDWFLYELPKFGDARLLGRNHNALLFSVQKKVEVPRSAVTPKVPMLYDSVPKTGESLCARYMGGAGCL